MNETKDYSLLIRTPVHKLAAKTGVPTQIPGGNITERAENWQRNIVWKLGADTGTFSITGDAVTLESYFDNWLTYDVLEMTGGVASWNGMIWEMTLNYGSMPVSLARYEMYNRIIGIIGDGIGTYTAAQQDLPSQARFGTRTKFIETGTDVAASAVYEAQAFLKRHAWPRERPTGTVFGTDYARLDVTVHGYGSTLNDMYADDIALTPASGVSAALLVTMTDSEYINPRGIVSNTTALYDDVDLIEAGELVKKLLGVSDSSYRLYRGWVDAYRSFRYKVVTSEPTYFMRGGNVYATPGSNAAINPRLLQPGIYRNLDRPASGQHRDSWFADRRDVWVHGVSVTANGEARYQSDDLDMSDYGLLWMEASA